MDLDIPSTRIGASALKSSRIPAGGRYSSKSSMQKISIKPNQRKKKSKPYLSQKRQIMSPRESLPSLTHRRKYSKIPSKSPRRHKPINFTKHLPDRMSKLTQSIKNVGYKPTHKGKFKDFPITLSRKVNPLKTRTKPSFSTKYLDRMKAIDIQATAEIDLEELKREHPELYNELKRDIADIIAATGRVLLK